MVKGSGIVVGKIITISSAGESRKIIYFFRVPFYIIKFIFIILFYENVPALAGKLVARRLSLSWWKGSSNLCLASSSTSPRPFLFLKFCSFLGGKRIWVPLFFYFSTYSMSNSTELPLFDNPPLNLISTLSLSLQTWFPSIVAVSVRTWLFPWNIFMLSLIVCFVYTSLPSEGIHWTVRVWPFTLHCDVTKQCQHYYPPDQLIKWHFLVILGFVVFYTSTMWHDRKSEGFECSSRYLYT